MKYFCIHLVTTTTAYHCIKPGILHSPADHLEKETKPRTLARHGLIRCGDATIDTGLQNECNKDKEMITLL
jgi:hypothetical protein